ncbi:MAG TPA: N-methyl-L-tryptophan oxidase [Thermomicrobiales bacterium]|jgi:sarcosine oxidase|nr:N-methyl-L-tryptophan oxidase [Thermomicrobiales bacterium]
MTQNQNPSTRFDVIVLGGGTMGTGAALALSRRGLRVLVLEQFTTPSTMASHSGRTRIIRQAYFESPAYVPMVRDADRMWVEIGEETGRPLLHRCGGLDISSPGMTQAENAAASAAAFDVPFEMLSGAEVNGRWPQFRLPSDWTACYSPVTGFLDVDPGLVAMRKLAHDHGAEWHEHEGATGWAVDGDGVTVTTAKGSYRADRLVVSAGAWAGKALADLGLPLVVRRKLLWWYEMADRAAYSSPDFPVVIADVPGCQVYVIPISGDDPGLKAGQHDGGEPTDPDELRRQIDDDEATNVTRAMNLLMHGVGPIRERAVCMYTMTPDEDFIVDRHPQHEQVVFAAGFSGHGFKFAPAMGEHLADLVVDPSSRPLDHIALARLSGVVSRV